MSISLEQASIGHFGRPLLTDFSLRIPPGSTTALIGPNGTGKTTVVNTLLGLIPLLSGSATLNGASMADFDTRRNVGVVWQDRGMPVGISVDRWMNHIASLYESPVDLQLADSLGVQAVKRSIRQLSGGEQQRLAIWSALNHKPGILIMDEPTVGLDEATRNTFYEVVRHRVSLGACALLTSHYAQDVSALADHVIAIGQQQTSTKSSAIFSTSAPLEVDSVAIDGIDISLTGNGYLISSEIATDLLGIASSIAASQNVSVRSFTVITDA